MLSEIPGRRPDGHITIDSVKGEETRGVGSRISFGPATPAEHGRQWIEIELDHPVNPWEHEGAGTITWGANLDRLAPLGEEAVGIIREAWEQRREDLRDRAKREPEESEPVDRVPTSSASIKPGWASRVEFRQSWIHLTLYQPINERWHEEEGENWSRGELVNDGIVKRGVTFEATTHLGRRALRIVETLHGARPFNELKPRSAALGVASERHSCATLSLPGSRASRAPRYLNWGGIARRDLCDRNADMLDSPGMLTICSSRP